MIPAAEFSPEAVAGHWTRNEGQFHTDPARSVYRSACACGWKGPEHHGILAADNARTDGDAHRAEMKVGVPA